jgi:hypothetical protein
MSEGSSWSYECPAQRQDRLQPLAHQQEVLAFEILPASLLLLECTGRIQCQALELRVRETSCPQICSLQAQEIQEVLLQHR